ncbi:MAG: IS3 family transposase [Chitinophagaceae bacterium]
MKDVYEVACISKQAVHQRRIRELQNTGKANEFFEKANKIRKGHPRSGCRKMALDMVCKGWGRDKIENLLLKSGYRICYPPNYTRTTQAQHELYFPNLIEGLELTGVNQVIQTDITYYRIGDKFYYLVFIIDVYSRRIVGHMASKTLEAEANIKALTKMLDIRKNDCLDNLIHHSDKGSQYIDKEYLKILKENKIRISMCNQGWENAYSERINRTIKEEYLDGWEIKDYATLSRLLKKAVHHYNHKRRHQNLNWQTPVAVEINVKKLQPNDRFKMKLYNHLEDYPQNRCE